MVCLKQTKSNIKECPISNTRWQILRWGRACNPHNIPYGNVNGHGPELDVLCNPQQLYGVVNWTGREHLNIYYRLNAVDDYRIYLRDRNRNSSPGRSRSAY